MDLAKLKYSTNFGIEVEWASFITKKIYVWANNRVQEKMEDVPND